jgi:WD40 repeat protein
MFAPEKSLVRDQFDQKPRWVQKLPQVQEHWTPLLQTLEGHSDAVEAVAFSQDGKLLASASWDRTVKLWDPATGAALQTLAGHADAVNTVAFSQDGKLLASASRDNTVRLWDPTTGPAADVRKPYGRGRGRRVLAGRQAPGIGLLGQDG